MLLVSIEDIEEGVEITFDYSHSHNKGLDFECNCKSSKCRKIVRSTDWKNKKYREENLEYYSEWLKDLAHNET